MGALRLLNVFEVYYLLVFKGHDKTVYIRDLLSFETDQKRSLEDGVPAVLPIEVAHEEGEVFKRLVLSANRGMPTDLGIIIPGNERLSRQVQPLEVGLIIETIGACLHILISAYYPTGNE